jgi:hypothetical protein
VYEDFVFLQSVHPYYMNPEIKKKLLALCMELIDERIRIARAAASGAQEAANEETKATAGDKHETARAIMQMETDKHSKIYNEARMQKNLMEQVNIEAVSSRIRQGSIVITTNGNFFLLLGLGKITLGTVEFYAIAPGSPIGKLLMEKKAGDAVEYNGRSYLINEVL